MSPAVEDFAGVLDAMLTTIVGMAGVWIAWEALSTWKQQLRGTTKHQCALELGVAVRTLEHQFFEARSPMYEGWEFPTEYYQKPRNERTAEEEAKAWMHVYNNRWKEVWPHVKALADMRAKIGTILGDEVMVDAEALARCARQLQNWMQHDAAAKMAAFDERAYASEEFTREAHQHVTVMPERNDKYSREFLALRNKVLAHLNIPLALS